MESDGNRDTLPPSLGFRTKGTILTVPEQIADRICADILAGRYRPGERIRELRLAQLFEVSRGPVREALRILEREGLVTMSPRRGAQVTALSIAEVEQLFDIRAALSSLAAQQAARNILPDELEALGRNVAAMGRLAEDSEGAGEYVALSSQCSQIIATAARNPRLLAMLLSLWRQTLRYSQLGLGSRERRRESAGCWAELAAAVATGEAERAGAVNARTILLSKAEAVRRLHADADAGGPGGPGEDGRPAAR
ncbi:MAG: GntR family transcriptional regulator [Rhodobacteraceae bacterium]|nr:GntR family transcriptional regulator [Paracoccaceae bacterium]